MELKPLSGLFGAEVSGIDLADELSAETVAEIRSAFNDHHVLVFRDQELSPEAQMAFGERFGQLDTHPFVHATGGHDHVLDIVTEPDDKINFGGGWHSDLTFLERPDLGSILYAVDVPPAGGDTLFADQQAAYDALSPTMQSMLDGLVAVHSAQRQYGTGGLSTKSKAMQTHGTDLADTVIEHPVVRTHPENGRKGLFVNRAFTERIRGLRVNESDALLRLLYDHATDERFTCRVQWQPGTLTMWDNRAVQHYALHDYAGQRRHMRRITVKGDRPV
ncbi:MAG: TauD/TfdA family dioxygenase [Actinomycetota bacterium]